MFGIVVVDYKSAARTIRFLNEELSKIAAPHLIVIVNNGSTPDSDAELAAGTGGHLLRSPDDTPDTTYRVFILSSPENLGYAKANNLGTEFLRRHFHPQYYLISNNDLVLPHHNTYEIMAAVMERDPMIGCIGPAVVGPFGGKQSPHRFLSVWQYLIWPRLLYPFVWPALRKGLWSEIDRHAKEGYCYRLMGCFLLIRAEAFDKVKGFDPATFLYAEELILAERMKRVGYRMYFTTAVQVIHHHGSTTTTMGSITRSKTAVTSLTHYYKTYIGISSFESHMVAVADRIYSDVYRPVLHVVARWVARLMGSLRRDKESYR